MKAREAARLDMFERVATFETITDPEIIAKMPSHTDHITELRAINNGIRNAFQLQQEHPLVSTADKDAAREVLETTMTDISHALRAYAESENMVGVIKGFPASDSAFRRMTDLKLIAEARNLLKLANKWEHELVPFGTFRADLAAFEADLTRFETLEPIPKYNRMVRAGATRDIRKGFKLGNACIRKIDLLVNTLRRREPTYHADYRSRRNIDKPAGRTIPLSGTVTDSNGNPLKGVIITVDNMTDTAKTTAKGNFNLRRLPDGVHILHFNYAGYRELTHTVAVNKGTTARADIQLREM